MIAHGVSRDKGCGAGDLRPSNRLCTRPWQGCRADTTNHLPSTQRQSRQHPPPASKPLLSSPTPSSSLRRLPWLVREVEVCCGPVFTQYTAPPPIPYIHEEYSQLRPGARIYKSIPSNRARIRHINESPKLCLRDIRPPVADSAAVALHTHLTCRPRRRLQPANVTCCDPHCHHRGGLCDRQAGTCCHARWRHAAPNTPQAAIPQDKHLPCRRCVAELRVCGTQGDKAE